MLILPLQSLLMTVFPVFHMRFRLQVLFACICTVPSARMSTEFSNSTSPDTQKSLVNLLSLGLFGEGRECL